MVARAFGTATPAFVTGPASERDVHARFEPATWRVEANSRGSWEDAERAAREQGVRHAGGSRQRVQNNGAAHGTVRRRDLERVRRAPFAARVYAALFVPRRRIASTALVKPAERSRRGRGLANPDGLRVLV